MSEKKNVSLEASTIKASSSDLDVSSLPSVNAAPVAEVTALSDGLYHIKWTFDISSIGKNSRGRQEETFKLDQHSQASYKLTLKYQKQDPEPDQCECSPDIQFIVNLKLKREACPTSQCLISKNGRDQSVSVWARVGRCQTIILDQSPNLVWKSESFSAIPDWDATEIPCQFWIKFYQSVGEINAQRQFANLFRNQLNCDVTFSFDEIEEDESIGGHAIILSARSSVFAALFQRGMQETNTRKVCIKDIKPDIFKQLLHYIYSGQTSTKLSEETAQPLFVAANMYDIEDLKDECVQFLLTCIKLKNAINLMAWAHVHSVDSIKEAALDFVESHGKEICQQDDWERLIKNHPNLCLLATRRMCK
ncbi:hypothetical protein GHT06_010603 [Daphnia sinensis]|uniref:BTB domain-containing protein n=1 Tax=Daphnia sinensis TaxID=1820382 RepID=A0AAD5Q1B8_9CRUS|nr:hypothetical protein GHT06_010603 [Daphnia sinensis]